MFVSLFTAMLLLLPQVWCVLQLMESSSYDKVAAAAAVAAAGLVRTAASWACTPQRPAWHPT
jgi:hypothetical protein